VHQLCTKALAQDETQPYGMQELCLHRRNGIKGKSTELNSLERDETSPGQTLDLLIRVRLPAFQPFLFRPLTSFNFIASFSRMTVV
jgi:hypothetical protein